MRPIGRKMMQANVCMEQRVFSKCQVETQDIKLNYISGKISNGMKVDRMNRETNGGHQYGEIIKRFLFDFLSNYRGDTLDVEKLF